MLSFDPISENGNNRVYSENGLKFNIGFNSVPL